MSTKVCVYGAGAIGGWIGVALGLAGCQVSAVARSSTLQVLQRNGWHIHRPDGSHGHITVTATDQPAALGPQDLIVLAVKAPALPDVIAKIGPLIGPDTTILAAMNGVPWWFLEGVSGTARGATLHSVDPDGRIARALPSSRILGCAVHSSCALDAPGVVRQSFGNRLVLGECDAPTSPRLQRWAGLLREAGIQVEESDYIQRDIWFKLWGNVTMNPISALTGATTDRLLADPQVLELVNAVMWEAKAVGAQLGITIDQDPEDRHAGTRKLGPFKTSMLQDLEANKPLEIDTLIHAVHELGQLTHTPTPHTSALFGLVRLMAQTRGLYPSSPAAHATC